MRYACIFLLLPVVISAPGRACTEGEVLLDLDTVYLSSDPAALWSADPFLKVPGYAQVKPAPEVFELAGVAYSEDDPIAVVNGQEVGEGDVVGGRTVEEIGKNYVILRKGDSLKELTLPPTGAK